MTRIELPELLRDVRACTECAASLPAGPRPVVQVGSGARIVIVGQAPGRLVHETGVPWNDPSGVRLRRWLDLEPEQFYDPELVAIIPMGFCYPGSTKSGDVAPRPECAPLWHPRLFEHLRTDRLEIIIGAYAQKRYLVNRSRTIADTVRRWDDYLPTQVVLPHPSPRNNRWLINNPWFERDTVPAVRARVREIVDE